LAWPDLAEKGEEFIFPDFFGLPLTRILKPRAGKFAAISSNESNPSGQLAPVLPLHELNRNSLS